MKKAVSLLMSVLLIIGTLSCLSVVSFAANVSDLSFELEDDGESYYVSDCSSSASGGITIPNKYNYTPVTSIGNGAFNGCSGLTSITIPSSVKNIDNSAFNDCSGLTQITVDSGNSKYSSVDGVLFNKAKTVLICCPKGKKGKYTIPNGVASIGYSAFEGCGGLTSITIPDSVTSISYSAFEGCGGLTSITIPNGVVSIDDEAFSGCSGLTSITIPNSVTSIDDEAFSGCNGLTQITVDSGNSKYSSVDGVLFNKAKTELLCCPKGKKGKYKIPNGVTNICERAFSWCSGLTSITIPNSVTSIGYSAFYNTAYYNDFSNWNNGVLYIGKYLIEADSNMLSNTYSIKSGTLVIADNAFSDCASLTSITIPNSVTSIGSEAFRACTGLVNITIPNSVTNIGNCAFFNCSRLAKISVASDNSEYSSVDGMLFNNAKTKLICCPKGKKGKCTIPDGVTIIGDDAFHGCSSLTSIIIPNSVTSMGISAFSYCSGLSSITIPNSVTSIGNSVFSDCSGLTNITIPNSVTSIGNSAFSYCSGFTNITIPDGVTSIGHCAFNGCSSLTNITIPNSVTSIGIWGPFSNPTGLTISCYRDSYAHIYAVDHNIKYKLLEEILSATKLTSIANTSTGITVKWAKVTGATGYYVYRKAGSAASWSRIDIITNASTVSYTDKNVKSGTEYTYTVRAYNASQSGAYNKTGLKVKYLAMPTLSVANAATGATVKWNKITGAAGYYVYRKAGSAKSWSRIETITNSSTVAYTDKNVKSGTKYTYTVRAYNGKTGSAYNTTGKAILFLAMPKVTLANAAKAVTVKWNKIAGATGYIVYRKAGTAKSWTKVATISKNATVTYTDKNVKSGTNYTYTVKAYYGKTYSAYNTKGVAIKFIAPTVLNSTVSGKTGITLKYTKVSAGTGYVIYRKTGSGSYAKLATIKGNTKVTYLDKTAKKGVTYTYVVRAYNGKFMSANSNAKSCKDKF